MKRLHQYSQHFLRSPMLIKELVGHSSIKKSDTVYDIGAGSGAISAVLAARCKQVVAVEYEPRTAEKLRENMKKYDNVRVLEGDFLDMPLPAAHYKVFANIPFHLSSAIVRKLAEAKNPPIAVYLVVQKQFAKKLLPDYEGFSGQLGMQIGPLFAARIRRPLRRTDFWPHPNVDTVFLELKLREAPLISASDMPAYRQFVEGCFSTPRLFEKTPRRAIGLTEGIRPSQMNLKQWVALYKASKKPRR